MASFVPPQVDHNLYTPILPQDNVMQIFSLLDQKQQFYNQGVKSAQNKISSMLSLEKDVTTDPVKNMVTDFNKKANDLIKQYANLDFSLQGNVQLIDNIYDPLLDNEVFLNDYTATKHYNTQVQKANNYRDSSDVKTRNLFNQTNLDVLTLKKQDLAAAKTEKDIKTYSARLANTSYTPYYDYNAELMGYMKDNKDMFEMSTQTPTGNGYLVTVKNGPQRYKTLKTFIDSFLSDKAKNQIEIEESVNFANAVRNSGLPKEQYLSNIINDTSSSYSNQINTKKEHLEELNKRLKTYPTKNLNEKQLREVDILKAEIERISSGVQKGEEIISDLNNFMQKASKGEIESSRFYDAAETLSISDAVETKIDNLANALVGTQSIEYAQDTTYTKLLEENRLNRQLNFNILDAQKKNEIAETKNMLDAAANGLVSAYYDPTTQKFIFGQPSSTANEFLEPMFEAAAGEQPKEDLTNIDGVNAKIDSLDKENKDAAIDATLKIVEARAALDGKPLNTEELKTLKNLITSNHNRSINAVYLQYKQEGKTNEINLLDRAGIISLADIKAKKGNFRKGIDEALIELADDSQNYLTNHTADQTGNNANYYNSLKTTVAEFKKINTLKTLEKEVIVQSAKKDLERFYKENPEYTGAFEVSQDGEIFQVYNFYHHNGLVGGLYEKNSSGELLEDSSGNIKKIADVPRENRRGGFRERGNGDSGINVKELFNDYLKTQEGALGSVANYVQNTIATNQGAFEWMQKNKSVYLNNPSTYELTEDEYKGSIFQQEGSAYFNSASTEREVLNTIQRTFMETLRDQRINLANKNVMTEINKIVEKTNSTVIYPNKKYLQYLFNIVDKEGAATDEARTGVADYNAFDAMLESIVKNGITVKMPRAANTSGKVIMSYLNAGNILPMKKTNGGSSVLFNTKLGSIPGQYLLEGKFESDGDFFLNPELSYRIDKATNSIQPGSNSINFDYWSYPLPATMMNSTLFDWVDSRQDGQLYFNQNKANSQFVNNLKKYIQARKGEEDQVSGRLILDYINSL